jgi:SOS-response transcriptional repressor LexA
MSGLTKAESKVLEAIKALTTPEGVSPSYKEIAELTGYKSVSNVSRLIMQLKRKNKIRNVDLMARSIQVIDTCQHCGKVLN